MAVFYSSTFVFPLICVMLVSRDSPFCSLYIVQHPKQHSGQSAKAWGLILFSRSNNELFVFSTEAFKKNQNLLALLSWVEEDDFWKDGVHEYRRFIFLIRPWQSFHLFQKLKGKVYREKAGRVRRRGWIAISLMFSHRIYYTAQLILPLSCPWQTLLINQVTFPTGMDIASESFLA